MVIRTFIADDHEVVRKGLRHILEDQEDIEIVGEAAHGGDVLRAVRDDGMDVVLLDLSMPGRNGIELIKEIKRERTEVRVLVLSMHEEEQYAVRAIRAGAHGYLAKTMASTQLLEALRKVAHGRTYLSPELAEQLALGIVDAASPALPAHTRLTDREYQVFLMLAKGLGVTAIGDKLSLSVKTVSTHKTRIFQKMGFSNIKDVIHYALKEGLSEEE